MSIPGGELPERLLDAQVAHAVGQLTDPDEFAALAREELSHFLHDASQLTLEQAVTRDMIKGVAHKYAIAFPVEGAIPELVGTVAARLFKKSADERYRLADLIDRRHYDELLTGIAELGLSKRVVDAILDSPTTVDACVEAVQRAVDTSRLPGSAGRLVDSAVESVVRRGTRIVLRANRAASDEVLLDAGHDLWRARSDQELGGVRELLADGDVEDAVVLVFEFWRTFRETEYFSQLLAEGVDEVFDTYGDTALDVLLAELGIGYDDLLEEALRFGPPVIAELDARGFLAAAMRRRFAPFYDSPEFAAAVSAATVAP